MNHDGLTGSGNDQGDAREGHQTGTGLRGSLSELRLGIHKAASSEAAAYTRRDDEPSIIERC